MTINELKSMTFDEAISILNEQVNEITDIEILKDYIKLTIDEDNFLLATHLLNAIYDNENRYANTYYYKYDYTAGTCDKPQELNYLEDLEQFCEGD